VLTGTEAGAAEAAGADGAEHAARINTSDISTIPMVIFPYIILFSPSYKHQLCNFQLYLTGINRHLLAAAAPPLGGDGALRSASATACTCDRADG
jgi:hypothetical protein